MIDLHTHTSLSDGTFTPEQLIQLALDNKLTAIAITDHDTIDGVQPAMDAAAKEKLDIVPGVELSIAADLPGQGHLHLLGLFIDHNFQPIIEKLDYLRSKRIDRIYGILDKLQELDIALSTDDLDFEGAQVSIGRPHIARLMANNGYVRSMHEAFDRYLAKDRPAFVEKEKINLEEAVQLIHDAAGLAIVAHPISFGYEQYEDIKSYLEEILTTGIDGLEVYSSFHPPEFTEYLLEFARQKKLCISGGSDFHGLNKPEIELGNGLGNLKIPNSVYEQLKKCVKQDKRN